MTKTTAHPLASPTWPRCWDGDPKKIDADVARTLIRLAQNRANRMQEALTEVMTVAGAHAARRMQRRYLLSFSARLAAIWKARSSRKRLSEYSDDEILNVVDEACALHAWHSVDEIAIAWPKEKKDCERLRVVHSFGPRQRALDQLAAAAGRCLTTILPTQFNRRGAGMAKFRSWLEEHLPSTSLIITVDIPSCFDVVSQNSVVSNPFLPKRVVEAAMFNPMNTAKRLTGIHTHFAMNDTHDVGTSSGKRGIPQGSALAQLVADLEVDKVLRAVAATPGVVQVAAYSDNLIFLLEDAGWKGSAVSALTDAVTKQFGADVTTELVHRIRFETPSSFHFCRRTYNWRKGKLTVCLPETYIDDYVTKTSSAIMEAYAAKSEKSLDKCEASIEGFAAQHSGLAGVLYACAELLAQIIENRKILKKKSLQGSP